jgi:hypothetical protein
MLGYSVVLTGDSNKPCWERVVGYYKGFRLISRELRLSDLRPVATGCNHGAP